jgi:hypothetical protein
MNRRKVLSRVFIGIVLVLAVAGAVVIGEMIDMFKRIG